MVIVLTVIVSLTSAGAFFVPQRAIRVSVASIVSVCLIVRLVLMVITHVAKATPKMAPKSRTTWLKVWALREADSFFRRFPAQRSDHLSMIWIPLTIASNCLAYMEEQSWQLGLPFALSGLSALAFCQIPLRALDHVYYRCIMDPLDEKWIYLRLESEHRMCLAERSTE